MRRLPKGFNPRPVFTGFVLLLGLLWVLSGWPRAEAQETASDGPAPPRESTAPEPPKTRQNPKPAPTKQYRWLFKERREETKPRQEDSAAVFEKLDQEIKQARKAYLAGETDQAITQFAASADTLIAILEETPPGNPLLNEIEERLTVFEEFATKILGPAHLEPKEETANRLFPILEKRRVCKRNLALKKAGPVEFFDVPKSLLKEEAAILEKLLEAKRTGQAASAKSNEETLRQRLLEVRASLEKSSPAGVVLRRGEGTSLPEVRRDVLRKDEILLDFNLFGDRMVVGFITTENALYYQAPYAGRVELDRAVFHLQDMLKEFALTGKSSFMGHAWKEPSRRIHRSLFGNLPPIPTDKRVVLVIPDGSLWYLPLSLLLDQEDRPFGNDRLVTKIPSVDLLRLTRSRARTTPAKWAGADLLLFEAIPWVSEDQIREATASAPQGKRLPERISEEERIERIILRNPVYPKPTEMVVSLQKLFKKFDVWVGPTATVERFLEHRDPSDNVTVMAIPLGMADRIEGERQPAFYFSPDGRGKRRMDARALFATPLGAHLLVLPISWIDLQDRDVPIGEGPMLLCTALAYGGTRACLINYCDPNWGSEEPFLLAIMKKIAEKVPPREALAGYSRDMPANLDESFSGKPPSWAGWILMGDPH